jgi:hypothetical protein
MRRQPPHDLVVLVADDDMAGVLSALLDQRQRALRVRDIDYGLMVHPGHDPALRTRAHEDLRGAQGRYRAAVVLLDREGSGAGRQGPEMVEAEIEARLRASGWPPGSAVAIVIDPELEAWVWGQTVPVARALGLSVEELGQILMPFGVDETGKVRQPKSALRAVLRRLHPRRPRSPAVLAELAKRIGKLERCQDRAFRKLLRVLREWFPAEEA